MEHNGDGNENNHQVGHLEAPKANAAHRQLTEGIIQCFIHGERAAGTEVVDDGTARALHGQRGNHGGHVALCDKQAVDGADDDAERTAEQQHHNGAARLIQHFNAEAADDGKLGAHGNINLPGRDNHAHAHGNQANHRALHEKVRDIGPGEEVRVHACGDHQKQDQGKNKAVFLHHHFEKLFWSLFFQRFKHFLHPPHSHR